MSSGVLAAAGQQLYEEVLDRESTIREVVHEFFQRGHPEAVVWLWDCGDDLALIHAAPYDRAATAELMGARLVANFDAAGPHEIRVIAVGDRCHIGFVLP